MTEGMVCRFSEGLLILVEGTQCRVSVPWQGQKLPFRSPLAFPREVHSKELVKAGSP